MRVHWTGVPSTILITACTNYNKTKSENSLLLIRYYILRPRYSFIGYREFITKQLEVE